VRVTTAFNKMLSIPGATVASVEFTAAGVVVGLRRRAGRPRCPCGWKGTGTYDTSTRRWRHLDLGASKLLLQAEIRRVDCRRCRRVRTEAVPWARPGARHTRDFEDVVAWLCQHTDKTTVTKLLRTSWETVAGIVRRVVAEHLDTRRLENLYRIGVDEVSWRKGHRYLTVVADHDRDGAVVWAGEGRDHTVLEEFYDTLGKDACAALQAVSLDMGGAYKLATDTKAGQARQCVDPFHVVKLANEAIDNARRWAWNLERRTNPAPTRPHGRPAQGSTPAANKPRWVKHTRWACSKTPTPSATTSSPCSTRYVANARCSTGAGSSKKACATCSGCATPTKQTSTSTGGSPGRAAAASPRSSRSPRRSAPTATGSSPPSSSAYRTPNSKGSTARSA
jgi:transposase